MKKILIIEDEEPLRSVLRDKLRNEGFEVLEARNGVEGLEVSLRKHPDLILLDIVMPLMDGLAMLKKIRQDAWGKSAQIVVLTNWGEIENVAAAVDEHAFDYLVKSDWKIEDIVYLIRRRLDRSLPPYRDSPAPI